MRFNLEPKIDRLRRSKKLPLEGLQKMLSGSWTVYDFLERRLSLNGFIANYNRTELRTDSLSNSPFYDSPSLYFDNTILSILLKTPCNVPQRQAHTQTL